MKYGIFAVVILSFFVYYGADTNWPAWCLLTFGMLGLALWVFMVGRAVEYPEMLMLALYVTANALVLIEYKPATAAPGIEIGQILAIKNLASTALIEFWILSAGFWFFWKRLREPMGYAFYAIGLLHSLSLIYDQLILRIVTGVSPIGLLGNRSIGASFAVVWVFYCIYFAENWPMTFTRR